MGCVQKRQVTKINTPKYESSDDSEEGSTISRDDDKFERDYNIIEEITTNPTIKIYKVQSRVDRLTYRTMIRIQKSSFKNKSDDKIMKEEFDRLQNTQHSHIIKLYDNYINDSHYKIIADYCKEGVLETKLRQKGVFSEYQTKFVAYQLLQAVKYLNENNLVHTDIKPDIIYINKIIRDRREELYDIKLLNFGSTLMKKNSENFLPYYIAPEVTLKKFHATSDVWSIGIIIYQMIYDDLPFKGYNAKEIISKIRKEEVVFKDNNRFFLLQDLLKKMLIKNPLERITVDECLEHRWFKKDDIESRYENSKIKEKNYDRGYRSSNEEEIVNNKFDKNRVCSSNQTTKIRKMRDLDKKAPKKSSIFGKDKGNKNDNNDNNNNDNNNNQLDNETNSNNENNLNKSKDVIVVSEFTNISKNEVSSKKNSKEIIIDTNVSKENENNKSSSIEENNNNSSKEKNIPKVKNSLIKKNNKNLRSQILPQNKHGYKKSNIQKHMSLENQSIINLQIRKSYSASSITNTTERSNGQKTSPLLINTLKFIKFYILINYQKNKEIKKLEKLFFTIISNKKQNYTKDDLLSYNDLYYAFFYYIGQKRFSLDIYTENKLIFQTIINNVENSTSNGNVINTNYNKKTFVDILILLKKKYIENCLKNSYEKLKYSSTNEIFNCFKDLNQVNDEYKIYFDELKKLMQKNKYKEIYLFYEYQNLLLKVIKDNYKEKVDTTLNLKLIKNFNQVKTKKNSKSDGACILKCNTSSAPNINRQQKKKCNSPVNQYFAGINDLKGIVNIISKKKAKNNLDLGQNNMDMDNSFGSFNVKDLNISRKKTHSIHFSRGASCF